ncbi:KISc [Nesidiocoris tenuis]|uniref:Kinesin-like protein n=1 Tax=Nesidiocoris tenuis TaxID=355587 RepID=A0ABN7AEA0_9HEMI|nr:KISc [Nesidiocoris tenuis]
MKRTRLHKPPSKEGLVAKEPVTVYCRVRPTPSSSNEGISCIRISPPSHVRLLPPPSALSRKEYQYTFRKVFEESAGQKDVFEEVALPLVQNLLNGRNSLLFTYGVTGSGKTYTMTGTLRDGGIMPRCLDAIFDSIASCQAKRCTFKPDRLNWFEIQPDGIDAEADLYSRIAQNRVKRLEKKNSDPDIAQRVKEEVRQLPVNDDFNYAVFVTYVEIYNNSVFDLLDDIYDENSRIRPPQTKIVREDSNHNMFVHGVNELEVGSTDEAFEAYFYGQKRRRIAQTALNAESSRSHSIFTIRLVHAPLNEQGDGVDPDPKHMIVSQLALVDLAGSERTNRTKNTGMRLKEAGNINNSLLTLRVCLELLRENQNGANKIIPYRDSRLTHLFRNFFDGDGQVSMIICISPVVEECDETMQVLKFAEMAQEVSTSVHTPIRVNLGTPKRRKAIQAYEFEDLLNGEAKENVGLPVPEPLPILFDSLPDLRFFSMEDEDMLSYSKRVIKNGLEELENAQQNLRFDSMLESISNTARRAYKALNDLTEQERLNVLEKEKVASLENKCCQLESQNLNMKRKIEETESQVKRLKHDLILKDSIINRKTRELEKVKDEIPNKMAQAQQKLSQEHEKKLKTERSAWESELKQQKSRMRTARQVLRGAGDASDPKEGNALPSYVTPMRSRIPPSASAESIPNSVARGGNGTGFSGTGVVGARAALFNGGGSTHVFEAPGTGSTNTPRPTSRKMGIAVSNKRHRRSRSAGNDVWLEHRPVHEVPLNTIMQPNLPKRKSVTKLTDAKDVTEKTSKYCLMTQNADSDGDLETRLYKGDVIPTSGGGAQVMFNDVEVLRQYSPSDTSPSRKTPRQIREDLEAACAQSSDANQRKFLSRERRYYEV